VTAHLSDVNLFNRYNAVYAQRFSRPFPVRTTVGSNLGMSPGMLIEIDCIAYKPQTAGKRRSESAGKRPSRRRK
jgi:enamine deaminase RidA (YjgF/YER057c/UK114 family)